MDGLQKRGQNSIEAFETVGVPLMGGKEAFTKQLDVTRMEGSSLREVLASEREGWELVKEPEDVYS